MQSAPEIKTHANAIAETITKYGGLAVRSSATLVRETLVFGAMTDPLNDDAGCQEAVTKLLDITLPHTRPPQLQSRRRYELSNGGIELQAQRQSALLRAAVPEQMSPRAQHREKLISELRALRSGRCQDVFNMALATGQFRRARDELAAECCRAYAAPEAASQMLRQLDRIQAVFKPQATAHEIMKELALPNKLLEEWVRQSFATARQQWPNNKSAHNSARALLLESLLNGDQRFTAV